MTGRECDGRESTRSSSGPGRTAWPRRSRWPVPGARSGSTRRRREAGGGTRTVELTLPGFRHDMCSTILPLTLASPFFRAVDLAARGVELVHPDAPVAHPLDGGRAAVLERSVAATADGLGGEDGRAWRRLFGPLVRDADKLGVGAARGRSCTCRAIRWRWPGSGCRRCCRREGSPVGRFDGEEARALFAGIAAHSMLRLDRPLSASFGLVLATYAHAVGWPMVRGGASGVAAALVAELEAAGGEVVTGHRVGVARGPAAGAGRAVRRRRRAQLVAIAGDRLSARTRRRAERFRYGSGRVQGRLGARRARAVGRRGRRAARRRSTSAGRSTRSRPPRRRSPPGRHPGPARTCCSSSTRRGTRRARPTGKTTAWAYCHVPAGSDVDMTDRIEAQVERFAPGFRDRILGPRRPSARPRWRRTTRTTSAATSTAASRTSAS